MGSLEGRIARLEAERRGKNAEISREALRHLSDEDLAALEDALGAGQVVRELEARVAEVEEMQLAHAEESRRRGRELLASNRALVGLPPLEGEE